MPYLDDVAIYSASWSEHMQHLRAVLTSEGSIDLRDAGLTVKAPKCQKAQAEVVYLGHVIGQGRRRPSELKTDIRSFLGVAGYYQRYIPSYSELASALTDALRKKLSHRVSSGTKRRNGFQRPKERAGESTRATIAGLHEAIHGSMRCERAWHGRRTMPTGRERGGTPSPLRKSETH